jgi:hypothetical protein
MVARAATPLIGSPELLTGPEQTLTVGWTVWGGLEHFYATRVAVSSGSPQTGFSEPQVISEPGDYAFLGNIVSDEAGDQLAVWSAGRAYNQNAICGRYMNPCPFLVGRGLWYARRPAGRPFEAPLPVAAPASNENQIMSAMDARGDAVVAYAARNAVYVRRGSANGIFGAPLKVAGGAPTLRYIGIDATGEILVVTERGGKIWARLDGFGRPPASAQILTLPKGPGGYPFAGSAIAAIGSGGQALVAWTTTRRSGGDRTQVAYRAANRKFGKPRTFAKFTSPVAASIDSHGQALLVLQQTAGNEPRLESTRTGSNDAFASPTMLGDRGWFGAPIGESTGANTAVDSNGDIVISGIQRNPEGPQVAGTTTTMEMLTSVAGEPFSQPVTLSTGTPTLSWPPVSVAIPAVAVDNQHLSAATWIGPQSATSLLAQEWTPKGASPVAQIPLIVPTDRLSVFAPSSLLDFGEKTHPNRHGQLLAQLSCGSESPGPCTVQVTIETADTPSTTVLAHASLRIPANTTRHVVIGLDTQALRLLGEHRTVHARVATLTLNGIGSPTPTDYPLLITR